LGAFGFDQRPQPGVNVACNIESPLPLQNECADLVYMSHVIEHVSNLVGLMEEVYRVCKPGAAVEIVVPYYTSRGAFRDPTHVRYITEDTFQYFEPPTDYGIRTNFSIEKIVYEVRKPFRWFPRYLQKRCRRYLWNVVDNMLVTLRARKDDVLQEDGLVSSRRSAVIGRMP
jgi:ubiquinone/menaquinone biosynthesis C-methylase UbiE